MKTWTTFECPRCHEAFKYEPNPQAARRIEEMELKLGRACQVMVDCPHCPQVLVLDRQRGRAEELATESLKPSPRSGMIYDMSLSEKSKEEVGRLNEEGHHLMTRDVARAEARFRQALSLRKHHPMTWYNLGVCRFRAGDLPAAEQCLRHALRFDASLVQGWNNLGSILAEQGRLEEADEIFDRGLEVDASYPKFYLGKANIAAMKGDFRTARRFLSTALDKDPLYRPAEEALRRLDAVERLGLHPPRGRA